MNNSVCYVSIDFTNLEISEVATAKLAGLLFLKKNVQIMFVEILLRQRQFERFRKEKLKNAQRIDTAQMASKK